MTARDDVAASLQHPPSDTGLSSDEAARRLAADGPNALPEAQKKGWVRGFVAQFQSPLIAILLFALVFDLAAWLIKGASGVPLEALTIAMILLLSAAFGTAQAYRAEAALEHLKQLAVPQTWVLRDGVLVQRPSRDLVRGDVVRLEAGDRVPADGVAQRAVGLAVDESVLTGESVPVDKTVADRLLTGTLVTRGQSMVQVEATGGESTLGQLSTLLGGLHAEKTPLETRLDAFGNRIARWVGVLAALIVVLGVMVEGWGRFTEVFVFAVALAVAAVPEGLPAVLTTTLALGTERMARRQAVVRRLAAVEALGSVTVIATDKTGTLTENRMQVRALDAVDEEPLLKAMVFANDADLNSGAGDPTEAGQVVSYFKGAPEVLLARSRLSDAARTDWLEKIAAYGSAGLRTLALARGEGEGETELTFLGLVLLHDPTRSARRYREGASRGHPRGDDDRRPSRHGARRRQIRRDSRRPGAVRQRRRRARRR